MWRPFRQIKFPPNILALSRLRFSAEECCEEKVALHPLPLVPHKNLQRLASLCITSLPHFWCVYHMLQVSVILLSTPSLSPFLSPLLLPLPFLLAVVKTEGEAASTSIHKSPPVTSCEPKTGVAPPCNRLPTRWYVDVTVYCDSPV